jgi:molybdopterin molybdotransferase
MVTVKEARAIVLSGCRVLDTVEISFDKAVGYVLAEDIISGINIPAFPQSSMDGFAIRLADKDIVLAIQDELPAGTSKQLSLLPFSAIKVFTGGPVPEGADTVVQKEKAMVDGNTVRMIVDEIFVGENIRLPGTDIGKGMVAIPAGTCIQSIHIGFMASLGLTNIPVIRKPSVAIIITGNELVQPGNELGPGQVYESNSFGLNACLQQMQVTNISVSNAKDDLLETEKKIGDALADNDIILITGGVSAGDYDYVYKACENLSIQKHFHGVKQRPGKPLYYGKKENKYIFGLPGNPASVLSCFYQYVVPVISILSGVSVSLPIKAKLANSFEKKSPLTFFLKGAYTNGFAKILPGQASFQLSSFVNANCWIELDEAISFFDKGTEVTIHRFL